MAPKVERIVEGLELAEGPHWDAERQALYFVDVVGHYIHKYVPSTQKHTKANIGKNVSIIIPVAGKTDQFVITIERQAVLITWDGESDTVTILQNLFEVDENTSHVFNDGKCDPSGRLWAGTMGAAPRHGGIEELPDEECNLFSFEKGTATKRISGIGISNGLAYNVELKKLYYVDTCKGTLDQYDFDITTGEISNEKTLYTLNKERGFAATAFDGMTIDTEGNLWVTVFGGSKVVKIDPRKPETIVDSIDIPAKQVTSVNFGGPNLDELYVTTARLTLIDGAPTSPDYGAVFRVTGVNAKGFPGVSVVL